MRDHIAFVVNGEPQTLRAVPPSTTLLSYLRKTKRLTGTKEGCAEGDCGACTVVVGELRDGVVHHRAVNACILLLPMLEGRSVVTVEHLQAEDGSPHPVQQALADGHGSQCGFCTPGFVMSLYAAYLGEPLIQLGQDPAVRLDQHPAQLGRVQRRVEPHRLIGEPLQLGQRLDPGEPAADHDERESSRVWRSTRGSGATTCRGSTEPPAASARNG